MNENENLFLINDNFLKNIKVHSVPLYSIDHQSHLIFRSYLN